MLNHLPAVTSGLLSDARFYWGFVLIGVLMVGFGVRSVMSTRRRRRLWVSRPGRIVQSTLHDSQFRVQVAFEHDGREVRFWNRYTSSGFGVDPVGRPVDVLVNPSDPADAVVNKGFAGGELVGTAFIVFGLIAAGAGAAMAGWI